MALRNYDISWLEELGRAPQEDGTQDRLDGIQSGLSSPHQEREKTSEIMEELIISGRSYTLREINEEVNNRYLQNGN